MVVQSLSHVRLFATPWTAARQASLSFTISWRWLRFMSIDLVMPSNHLNLCPLLFLPSIFPSIRVFSNELTLCIKWPKYWSFSSSPSNEYSGLISFRTDRFDLLVKVAQLCPTLCDPMDYPVCGILQARILEWVAFPFSRGSSQPWDRTLLTSNSSKGQCMCVSAPFLCVTDKKNQRAEWVF